MKRPALYVPLSVRFATGKTGTRIRQDFGRDGLLTWICFLVACKQNRPAGQITYASEAEAWMLLGLNFDPPDFQLSRFWRLTGALHVTRKRRVGELTTIECSVWDRWTTELKREQDAERSARYRAQSERDESERVRDVLRTEFGRDRDLEVEKEVERELEPGVSLEDNGRVQQLRRNPDINFLEDIA